MLFSALQSQGHRAHPYRVRETAAAYWERRNWQLRRILQAGGWTIHDLINRPDVRSAVRAQWTVGLRMEEDRSVEVCIQRLEYLEAVSQGKLPPLHSFGRVRL